LPWSIGAPLPHLLANGHTTYLLFYLANPDPTGMAPGCASPIPRRPSPNHWQSCGSTTFTQ
jgi:hypothetical protein